MLVNPKTANDHNREYLQFPIRVLFHRQVSESRYLVHLAMQPVCQGNFLKLLLHHLADCRF